MKFLTSVAAILFELVTTARNALFDRNIFSIYTSSLPIVSVGNVTVGGTGKTPLTIFLAQYLKSAGKNPVVLSRGFGGSERGPMQVDSSSGHAVNRFGDEPVMIAQMTGVPVVVAKNRVSGAKLIETQMLGDTIILDDGFQHRWLHRILNIVCIDVSSKDALDRFNERRLLPVGIFRENFERSLKRIDYLCFSRRALVDHFENPGFHFAETLGLPSDLPFLVTGFAGMTVKSFEGVTMVPQNISVLISIANPAGFIGSLNALGFTIDQQLVFPDHHAFKECDIERIEKTISRTPVVTSQKDYMRLSAAIRKKVWILDGDFAVETDDQRKDFLDMITRVAA